MATTPRARGNASTEEQDRPEQSQAAGFASEAFQQTQETMVRSVAELSQEMIRFASTLLRQNQFLLQSVTRNIGEAYRTQWAHLVSTNQDYVQQLGKLAEVTQRATQDTWGFVQAAAREQGETVSSVIESTAQTAEQTIDLSQANWEDLGATLKEQWDKLTDADLAAIESRDQLMERIQQRYGIARAEAERQIRAFEGGSGEGEGAQGRRTEAGRSEGGRRGAEAAAKRTASKRSRRSG